MGKEFEGSDRETRDLIVGDSPSRFKNDKDLVPSSIGSVDASFKAYYCTECKKTHCYGKLAEEHRMYALKDHEYEKLSDYAERYNRELHEITLKAEIISKREMDGYMEYEEEFEEEFEEDFEEEFEDDDEVNLDWVDEI